MLAIILKQPASRNIAHSDTQFGPDRRGPLYLNYKDFSLFTFTGNLIQLARVQIVIPFYDRVSGQELPSRGEPL
jgi:hypothetical protein